jgi:hypothetical protein
MRPESAGLAAVLALLAAAALAFDVGWAWMLWFIACALAGAFLLTLRN